jgi:hypothetical protein
MIGYTMLIAFELREASALATGSASPIPLSVAAFGAVWLVCAIGLPAMWAGRLVGSAWLRRAQAVGLLTIATAALVGIILELPDMVHSVRDFFFSVSSDYAFAYALTAAAAILVLLRVVRPRRPRRLTSV